MSSSLINKVRRKRLLKSLIVKDKKTKKKILALLLESIISDVHNEEVRQAHQETDNVPLLPKSLVCPDHVVCNTLVSVGRGDGIGEDVRPQDHSSQSNTLQPTILHVFYVS